MARPYRQYTQAEREHAINLVRTAAMQGVPTSTVARHLGLNPRTVQYWATRDRQTYQARLSAIHTPGLRFPRGMSDKARLRRTYFALRRLSLYRQEHGIKLRPTPWPADDPRRRENKAKRDQADTTSSVAKPAKQAK